jgi:hypothetical protein
LRTTGEGYAIFQVTGIAPAHAPSFAEYKSKIADDYRERATARPAQPEDQGTGGQGAR